MNDRQMTKSKEPDWRDILGKQIDWNAIDWEIVDPLIADTDYEGIWAVLPELKFSINETIMLMAKRSREWQEKGVELLTRSVSHYTKADIPQILRTCEERLSAISEPIACIEIGSDGDTFRWFPMIFAQPVSMEADPDGCGITLFQFISPEDIELAREVGKRLADSSGIPLVDSI